MPTQLNNFNKGELIDYIIMATNNKVHAILMYWQFNSMDEFLSCFRNKELMANPFCGQ